MANRRSDESPRSRRPRATTPEGRENQLTALAYDLAEKQLNDGTASAPIINHFLRAGSTRGKIEEVRLQMEVKLAEAKIEAMNAMVRQEELFAEAIKAMRSYQGSDEPLEEGDYDA